MEAGSSGNVVMAPIVPPLELKLNGSVCQIVEEDIMNSIHSILRGFSLVIQSTVLPRQTTQAGRYTFQPFVNEISITGL